MTRVDRLTAIVFLIQERKRTGEELAKRFEISRRTVLRDIQALCEMGLPVIAEWGPGGGYSLDSSTLGPLALNRAETFLLLVALKSVANARGIVDSAGREALIAKVRALIPEQERATASAWADNVGVPGKATAQPEPRHLEALLTALGDNRWVEVEYSSARRDSTQSLRPEKLYLEEGFWYLRAFSAQHRAVRTYRADRMKKVAPLDRAPNYAIADAPPAYGDPSLPEVVIALTRPGAKEASRSFPYLEVLEEQDGPRLRVRCPPHEYPWYARAVLGMAGEARALEPAPFVTCVAELAREIARIHEKR